MKRGKGQKALPHRKLESAGGLAGSMENLGGDYRGGEEWRGDRLHYHVLRPRYDSRARGPLFSWDQIRGGCLQVAGVQVEGISSSPTSRIGLLERWAWVGTGSGSGGERVGMVAGGWRHPCNVQAAHPWGVVGGLRQHDPTSTCSDNELTYCSNSEPGPASPLYPMGCRGGA